ENGGTYDPGWLDQENFEEVLELYPRANIEASAQRMTATQQEFKDDFARHSHGDRRLSRYDYNPLVSPPFVAFQDGLTVAPATRLIMRTVTPGGLYSRGTAHFGTAFS